MTAASEVIELEKLLPNSGGRGRCRHRGWLRQAGGALALLGMFCLAPRLVRAANLPPGFTEATIPGPNSGNWNEAVGLTFDSTGRMFVWERAGRIWIKDPADAGFSLLLNISEEVAGYADHGLLGVALDPNFRINGYIYLLYDVDRYHLLNYGTPGYDPAANAFFAASIGRLTRYACTAASGFRSVDLASRFVMIGTTKQNGFPIMSQTHGVGTLVFGEDGSLLISCGDGASPFTTDLGGPADHSYAGQGRPDQIIRAKEDIGSFRSQLVDCLNGKILRIDPATGNGLPSNPYYDPANPASAQSRVWALGLRNPFRVAMRPETGSHNPDDGNPGVLYVGEVGWDDWESLKVVTRAGQNFGWPIYEGLAVVASYDELVSNLDAPNPLYPAGGCRQYFAFTELLKEDTLNPAGQPPFANPCNSAQRIPSSIPQFLHSRPVLDWNHGSAITRTPTYGAQGQAQIANVGDQGSPVSGTEFQGNCSVGGTWYTGTNFPAAYQNTYFHADWGQAVIKNMVFDGNDNPVSVADFADGAGAVVCITQHPFDGSMYYVSYTYGDFGTVRRLTYTGNRTPVAVAAADKTYGPGALVVQFSSQGSVDPDGGPLTYSWNFGDGSALSTAANPSHAFNAPGGTPTRYEATLTVGDSGGLSAQAKIVIGVNDTPPNVVINSPVDGSVFSLSGSTVVNLSATVSDAESSNGQLLYSWQTLLHHNEHNHVILVDSDPVSSSVLSPVGCDGINVYYYRILLTVTDPVGLATTKEVRMYPDCGPNTPPVISSIPNQITVQDRATGPINFTISDAQMLPGNLQLSAQSSNPLLLPNANILFGGSGGNRFINLLPADGQNGTATLTVFVSDGPSTSSESLVLTVNPPSGGTLSVTNALEITIPSIGIGNPYPSYLEVGGLGGTINQLTVRLTGLSHSWVPDLDVLLVGPGGQKVVLMSDVASGQANNVNLTLSDSAGSSLPQSSSLTSGTYKPANYDSTPTDNYPAPAPGSPYAGTLSTFNGTSANGTWALYVVDDGNGDQGSFAGGWNLSVVTTLAGAAPTISVLSDQETSMNTPTAAMNFSVNDADTPGNSLVLSGSSSNPALVPDGDIVFGGSGNNRNVTVTPAPGQSGVATVTVRVTDTTGNWSSSGFIVRVNGGANTAPSISSIANQTTAEDVPAGAVGFNVGDGQTPAGSLTLSGSSSDQLLVPNGNIVFGGSGASRTVTVTPALNRTGTATITVTVSDGSLTANAAFELTVTPVNDAPTISSLADRVISVGNNTGAIGFTVGDAETAAGSLSVSGNSSNQTLVPDGNIVFGGSGANRTVTVTPAAGQLGTASIAVRVSDGVASTTNTFLLTVTPPNSPPTISNLGDRTIQQDSNTGPIGFMVGDAETAVGSLTVNGSSSDEVLVPNGNIAFGGSGANRTVTVTPAAGRNGTTTITVNVNDGSLTSSDPFVLTVKAVASLSATFANPAAVSIPSLGTGAPYPSTIQVAGMVGTISSVVVGLSNLAHQWPDDLDILLVSPAGQKVVLMGDAGGGNSLSGVNLFFSDAAATTLPDSNQIVSGTFKASNFSGSDVFPAPAPGVPYDSALAVFNNSLPNGAWLLFILDDGPSDAGSLDGGWNLAITCQAPVEIGLDILPPDGTGAVLLQLRGAAGQLCAIEASSDLSSWTELGVVDTSTGADSYLDAEAIGQDHRFYRARVQPP